MLNLEVVGQGATTKIYRDGNTAIKLYVSVPSDEADNEAERQRFACNAGLPVPVIYGVRKLNDNAVALDMEYIDGQPLMQPGMDKDERKNAIHALVMLQCEVHKVHASGLPKLTDRLTWKIKTTQYLEEPQKNNLLSLIARLNNDSDNLCHGDFHPLNILYDGSKHFGRPDGYKDKRDFTLIDALKQGLGSLDVPVLYDADIGHIPPQMQIVNGSIGKVEFTDGKATVWQGIKEKEAVKK